MIGFETMDKVLSISEAVDFLTLGSSITYEEYTWGMMRGVFDYLRNHEYLNKASIEWWRYILIDIPELEEFHLYEEIKLDAYHQEES